MSILLFSLRQVPDDEADDIRLLLDAHAIPFYETSAGNWGISMPAIWLATDQQLELAQQLIATYQQQRTLSQRQLYEQNRQQGTTPTFLSNLIRHPLRIILYTMCALLIVYLSLRVVTELSASKPSLNALPRGTQLH